MRTGKHSRTWWALAALLWLAPGLGARADVVDRPPADCPQGSVGDTCHGGPFCRPMTCSMDSECVGDATCQDVMACIGSIDCTGGGGGTAADPPIPTITGPCKDGVCGADTTCQAIKQCIGPVDPTTGGGGSSGGGSPTSGGTATSGTASTGGGTASSTGDGTGGGSKGGCTGCAAHSGDGVGGSTLALLAIAGLVRRRRRVR